MKLQLKGGTILLVEDNPDDVALTERALKKARIANKVVVAQDGVEALDFLYGTGAWSGRDTSDTPEVILLDLKLPKLDGLEILRRLRDDQRTKLLPVVVLTSSREDRDLKRAYELGANSYIRKPVDFKHFAKAVPQPGVMVGKKPIRVLIVEDSEDDALLLVRQLRNSGFDPSCERVDSVEGMRAALDRATWDVVLSDFVIPGFGGLAAIEMLRQRGFDIPLLIVSGKIGEETAVKCVKAGANDYMMKDNLGRLGVAVERELQETENRRVRRIVEERLRTTDADFRRVITSNADGMVVVSRDGFIRFANPAAATLLGQTAQEMVGSVFGFPLGEGTELEFIRVDGLRTTVEMRIVESDWEGGPALVVSFRDVSKRKQAMTALQQSESRLRLLLDQMPCVSWTLDTRLKFTTFSGSWQRVLKNDPDQLLGQNLAEYFKVDSPDFAPYIAHRKALQGTPSSYEMTWAGRTFYGRVESLRDTDGQIVGVAGVAFDITERKEAEEQLRNLSHRLVEAQENERRTIARELHDEVGQSLTALDIYMKGASLARSGTDGSELGVAREALHDLMARVRNMSLELRPSMLDDLGLLPTLLWHFKRYTAQTGVHVHFKHRGLRRDLPLGIITAAYRIVQEALTNVARYAQVTEVMVSVRAEHDALVVEVEDRGVGFDLDKVASTSMGLNGMRERVLSLNGKLLVQSTSGEGARLIAEFPLAKIGRKRIRSKEGDNRSSGG